MGGKKVTMRAIKRKSGPTHPNSRRALQLARVDQRIERLRAAKSDRKKLVGSKVNQHLTLVFLLPPDLNYIPDKSYLHSFLQTSYLDRHSEQLKELLAERRADRPPSLKLVELQNTIAKEKLEYDTGFEIPDLMNEANVRLMREWNGDSQALDVINFLALDTYCRFLVLQYRQQYDIVQKGSHKDLDDATTS